MEECIENVTVVIPDYCEFSATWYMPLDGNTTTFLVCDTDSTYAAGLYKYFAEVLNSAQSTTNYLADIIVKTNGQDYELQHAFAKNIKFQINEENNDLVEYKIEFVFSKMVIKENNGR